MLCELIVWPRLLGRFSLTWGLGHPEGQALIREQKTPMLGDVLVFARGRVSGHVGVYVGEDATAYHVIGGNQGDSVSIKRIARSRLLGARRCPWRVNQPSNVRRVQLAASGAVSANEA